MSQVAQGFFLVYYFETILFEILSWKYDWGDSCTQILALKLVVVYAKSQVIKSHKLAVFISKLLIFVFSFLHLYLIPSSYNYIGHSGSWYNHMPSHKPKTPMTKSQIRDPPLRHQQWRKKSA